MADRAAIAQHLPRPLAQIVTDYLDAAHMPDPLMLSTAPFVIHARRNPDRSDPNAPVLYLTPTVIGWHLRVLWGDMRYDDACTDHELLRFMLDEEDIGLECAAIYGIASLRRTLWRAYDATKK